MSSEWKPCPICDCKFEGFYNGMIAHVFNHLPIVSEETVWFKDTKAYRVCWCGVRFLDEIDFQIHLRKIADSNIEEMVPEKTLHRHYIDCLMGVQK